MRPAFILLAMALIALTQSAAAAPPDTAPVIIAVSVNLDQTTQAAQVTDQSPGMVSFTGQVVVDKLPVQRAVVTMQSSVDNGWVSQISPSTAVFTSTTPQGFSVTVVVPQGTLSTETGRLLVTATMNSGGQTAEGTDNATITVVQYYRVNMTCDAPSFETDRPGFSTAYRVVLVNRGNGPDSFAVEIGNLGELGAGGWKAGLDMNVTPPIRPGASAEVAVTVTSPAGTPGFEPRTARIQVSASSVGARAHNQTISNRLQLTFRQSAIDPVSDVTVPIIGVAVAVAAVAGGVWAWRRKRARRTKAVPDPEEPLDVEPD